MSTISVVKTSKVKGFIDNYRSRLVYPVLKGRCLSSSFIIIALSGIRENKKEINKLETPEGKSKRYKLSLDVYYRSDVIRLR